MDESNAGQWAILELFGQKVVAGYVTTVEELGTPFLRLDVPVTEHYPGFSRMYNPAAIYSYTFVSKDVALLTAEQVRENPVTVYVPDLAEIKDLRQENTRLWEVLNKYKALEAGELSTDF